MAKNDSIIVLSHALDTSFKLTEESRDRLDKAISLFQREVADYLIMSGVSLYFETKTNGKVSYLPRYKIERETLHHPHHRGESRDGNPVDCRAMRAYASRYGVPLNRIFIEDFALDSVGHAYFVKERILEPFGWTKNIVVSSSHHIPRLEQIFRIVLGPDYTTKFEGAATKADKDQSILEREKKSLEMFIEQFGDIRPGDSKAIEERLYTMHNFYSRIPEKERLRFHTKPIKLFSIAGQ